MLAALGLALALTVPVGLKAATLGPAGATFTVTSTSDSVDANLANGVCAAASGACTLRAAIQQANALPGADAIVLPAGTYALAIPPVNQNLAGVGDLDVTDSVTIAGAGAGATIIDGGTPAPGAPPHVHGLDRLFEVSADGVTVVFSGLTLRDGWSAEYGGAIMNASGATVNVVDAMLTGNGAGKTGGAIENHAGGTVDIHTTTLRDNYAPEAGSALNNNRGGVLTVVDSLIASNSAADAGLDDTLVGAGAISNHAELDAAGSISITDSRVVDNRAGGGRSGAGISNDGAGVVSVERTTFVGNRAVGDGGAIFNSDGTVTIAGASFAENQAKDGGAISSSGLGSLTVTDSAFSKNVAADWGGAIQNGNKGSVTIRASTFTENSGLNGGGFGNEGSGPVTVESSTFTKNAAIDTATAVGGEGGGMHSNSGGEVVVAGGVFVDNRAVSGGGLSNEGGGQLTITGTRFASNRADEAGGGVLIQSGDIRMVGIDVVGNFSESSLEGGGGISYAGDKVLSGAETASLEGSRIRDNTAKGEGGGIDSRGDGPLVISTTSISGNRAALGGAVHHVGDAPLRITRSTLSGNVADHGGGVLTDGDGEAELHNATVSGNRAGHVGGGVLASSRLLIRNSTIAANSAPSGGGVDNGGGDLVGDGTVFLASSIVAGNSGGNCAGAITSRGGNVENANTCRLVELSDQPGTDPRLGPLAENGGPTPTHALLAGSPAQDRASCSDIDPCPLVDQRGVARPAFAGFDAGAYESAESPGGAAGQVCTGRTERPVPADYDSWISQSAPGANFGSDSILKVDAQGGSNDRALVHFALPAVPPGCKLVGATLRLYSPAATEGRTLEALRVASAWNEAGVTWASQPTTTGPATGAESGLDIREWNVLEQTLDLYHVANHGFLIRDRDGSGSGEQSFHSREKGDDRPPELMLVFDDPDAPPATGDCGTATPLRVAADRDSWVNESSPANNFGSDSTLKVKSQSGSNSRAYIHFPFPALPGGCTTVASAALRMEATSGKEGRTLVARAAAASWTEGGITWANQPGGSGPAAAVPSFDGPLEWNVTASVLGMYVGANDGFVIRDADENGVGDEQTINSRHKLTDVPPELVLVFDDSTPETTIASGPEPASENSHATFTFSSDRDDATFECALDFAPFAACTSPHTVEGLAVGTYVFEVRAKRPIRAVDPTPATRTWTVADLTAPAVTLTGPPAGSEVEETSAAFEFSADEQAHFQCSLDGIVLECESPLEVTGLAVGLHTFEVSATDPSGNVGSASLAWTVVDRTAPVVTLNGPGAETEARSLTVTFSASEQATFACSLDGAAMRDCASPHPLADLALGAHELEVTATDPSGNTGFASAAWTVVDRTAPEVSLAGPKADTEERSATFTFSASEPAVLACALDEVPLTACESPLTVTGLELGEHVFEVSATDPSGNTGSATDGWTVVDRTAPEVTLDGPTGEVEDDSATLTFSANEAVTFTCTLDGLEVAGCASPLELTGLGLGEHLVEISATDPSGNTGSASVRWTVVDVTAPAVQLSGPDARTEDTTATFTFSADEQARFACALDGVRVADCSSPLELTGLALGKHSFEVTATDPSENAGAAIHTWEIVDETAPVVTVAGPGPVTEDATATLTFSANEPATLACALDGTPTETCESPLAVRGLALGTHRFSVGATDASGNTGSATHVWEIVDVTAPTVEVAGPEAQTENTSATLTFSANEPATLSCVLDDLALETCDSPLTLTGVALGAHRLEVSATDPSGNTGSAAHDWQVVDLTSPSVTLSGPEGETEETSATLVFEASEPATLACELDGVALAGCSSPLTLSGLSLGPHVLEVTATDGSGNSGSATHEWVVADRTPPAVTLTGPAEETEETTAELHFSADETVTFACSLDGVALADCASPLTLDALTAGLHTFEVEATDAAGNVGFAVHAWAVVDLTGPTVALSGPEAETENRGATLTFSANEPATLACSLDGVLLPDCESPLTVSDLTLGAHTFGVEATDSSGNTGSATHGWSVVDRTAPLVTLAGPDEETDSTDATFAFSANEEATVECSLDGVAVADCASPLTRSGLDLGPHRFDVTATDASGNAGSATHRWVVVDRTGPVVTLAGPDTGTEATSATLTFSANEPATFACALDGIEIADCESPLTRDGLGLGPHRFDVTATDESGNAGSATLSWTIVDRTAPEITLTGPPPETEERQATLTFSATEGAVLECRLDGADFAACPEGTASFSGLVLGSHRFDVRATDESANSASASHVWSVVDRSGPSVSLTGPEAETSSRSATLAFSTDEASTFTCALDGAAAAACTSPVQLGDLDLGAHSFRVEATDSTGNVGAATHAWTIVPPPDTGAPVITIDGPAAETNETSARLTFSASEDVTGFRCSLDDAAAEACTSPADVVGLDLGPHTFRVEATDLAGNAGAATHAWTIKVAPDTSAPVVTIAGPPETTPSTDANLTFTANELATFRCALDGDELAACASGVTYYGLALGEHVFRVEATDGARNQSVTAYAWTVVDSSAPAVTISAGPESPTTETTATFQFSASEPVAFRCSLDGSVLASCASGVTYEELAVGQHVFEVRATDSAGNAGSASWAWSIDPPRDSTAPVVTITSGPSSGTTATSASFQFSASEPATFRCSLDAGASADCAPGVSLSGLAAGEHTFRVEARDAAGNVGTASWSWTIATPPPVGCTAQTLTLGADADTWLLETSPTSNYGQDSVIKVDTKAGANARALVRFQLPAIPAGCTLRDARLRLYASSYKTGRTLLAVPAGSAWLQSSVTWNTQPSTTGGGVSTASGGGNLEWNVVSIVSSASGSVTFLIRDATEDGVGIEQGFHSREKGTDDPPRLVLTLG